MDRIGEERILKFLSLRTEAGAGESMCSRPPGGISNNYFMNGTTTLPLVAKSQMKMTGADIFLAILCQVLIV